MNKKVIVIISFAIVILVLIGLYLHFENTKLQISNYSIINSNIPIEFNNYKIVHISDFHNTKSKTLTKDLIEEIKNQKPNIIVLTGDLVDSRKTDIETSIDFIKKIKSIAPIYYVSGNHEANIRNYSSLKEQLEKNNVIILDNKVELLRLNDKEINLIGVDDPRMLNNCDFTDAEIMKYELDNIKYNENNYSILLSHRPELFDTYVEKELDLVLVGHAHGGQIRIPFIDGVVAPNQGFFPKYTSGTFEKKKTTMIISRGIGNSILPFRINNNPELVVVTLNNG